MPETFGGIVQSETDDQERGQGNLSLHGGLADGQALRKIMQTKSGRNHDGQPRGRERLPGFPARSREAQFKGEQSKQTNTESDDKDDEE